MIVAIHQPNYFPWLGYFAKIAASDVFVFLDDVQFSKGSYTNRVQIAVQGQPVWLSVPVSQKSATLISVLPITEPGFARSHRDRIKQAYGKTPYFKPVWEKVEPLLGDGETSLANLNIAIIKALSRLLNLSAKYLRSSELGIPAGIADERLAALVASIAPQGTYLSGTGGAKYQSHEAFESRGISLTYSGFKPMPYARSGEDFVPGLSILDALFHLGFDETSRLLQA